MTGDSNKNINFGEFLKAISEELSLCAISCVNIQEMISRLMIHRSDFERSSTVNVDTHTHLKESQSQRSNTIDIFNIQSIDLTTQTLFEISAIVHLASTKAKEYNLTKEEVVDIVQSSQLNTLSDSILQRLNQKKYSATHTQEVHIF